MHGGRREWDFMRSGHVAAPGANSASFFALGLAEFDAKPGRLSGRMREN